jgi:hypothetical protein
MIMSSLDHQNHLTAQVGAIFVIDGETKIQQYLAWAWI